MERDISDRERLAADLELLGALADPTQGPMASLFAPPPAVDTQASRRQPLHAWRDRLVAAWARFTQARHHRLASTRHLGASTVVQR